MSIRHMSFTALIAAMLAAGCSGTPTSPAALSTSSADAQSAKRPAVNGPDLVSDVPYLGLNQTVGREMWLSIRTTNQGNQLAGESYSRLYLSSDPVFDESDTPMTPEIYVKSLAPGESFSNNGSWGCVSNCVSLVHFFMPSAPGTYYYLVIADVNKAVAEANETNNVTVQRVQVR